MITKITILGREYQVKPVPMSDSDFGECNGYEGVIRINETLDPETFRSTLVHEVCHAILHESGFTHLLRGKQEEGIVRALEHGLIRSGLIIEEFD